MFPDNPCSLLQKLADESCAGIWKFPKELSDLGGGGWKGVGGGGGMNGPGPGEIDCGDRGGERLLLLLFLFLVLF